MTRNEFQDLAARGPVILDGATGSELRRLGMPVGVPPERWILEHRPVLRDLQRAYLNAGSMVIYAPTFSANRLSLRNFGLGDRVRELNAALVVLSREVSGGRALVAGDLSTLGRPLEPVGDMPYGEAYGVYREQMEALAEAGADLLVVETLMGADEAVAALDAAADLDLPVLCSFSAEADGSLLFGGNVREAAAMLQELGAAAVGVNCSVGPDQLESVIRSIRGAVDIPVIAKPNAGLPVMDEQGQARYSMGPEEFARHMRNLMNAGAGIVGGCCGAAPEYIRLLAAELA